MTQFAKYISANTGGSRAHSDFIQSFWESAEKQVDLAA
jgi:hypothetical protein